jgi:hypothetical protein
VPCLRTRPFSSKAPRGTLHNARFLLAIAGLFWYNDVLNWGVDAAIPQEWKTAQFGTLNKVQKPMILGGD